MENYIIQNFYYNERTIYKNFWENVLGRKNTSFYIDTPLFKKHTPIYHIGGRGRHSPPTFQKKVLDRGRFSQVGSWNKTCFLPRSKIFVKLFFRVGIKKKTRPFRSGSCCQDYFFALAFAFALAGLACVTARVTGLAAASQSWRMISERFLPSALARRSRASRVALSRRKVMVWLFMWIVVVVAFGVHRRTSITLPENISMATIIFKNLSALPEAIGRMSRLFSRFFGDRFVRQNKCLVLRKGAERKKGVVLPLPVPITNSVLYLRRCL